MTQHALRIASRRSRLALWQANAVKQQLQQYTKRSITIITFVTQGDKQLQQPLSELGGKGLFVKELEMALLNNRADLAVHSSKDLPAEFPTKLCLGAVCERGDPRDAFISNIATHISELPANAKVGTSSLRRQSQLAYHYPHLTFCSVRGNVETRLQKLDNAEVDALILAAAGLQRLDLEKRITHYFEPEQCLPAIGQGTLAVECRENDDETRALLALIHHPLSALCLQAERAFNQCLGGHCHVPIAGYATLNDDNTLLHLQGLVATPDGKTRLHHHLSDTPEMATELGIRLAKNLQQQGAQEIINAC